MSQESCETVNEVQDRSCLDWSKSSERDAFQSVSSISYQDPELSASSFVTSPHPHFPETHPSADLEFLIKSTLSKLYQVAIQSLKDNVNLPSPLEFTGKFGSLDASESRERRLTQGECMRCAEMEDQYRSLEKLMFAWREEANGAQERLASALEEGELLRREISAIRQESDEYKKQCDALLANYIDLADGKAGKSILPGELMRRREGRILETMEKSTRPVPKTDKTAVSKQGNPSWKPVSNSPDQSHSVPRSTSESMERREIKRKMTPNYKRNRGKSPDGFGSFLTLANKAAEWMTHLRDSDESRATKNIVGRDKGKVKPQINYVGKAVKYSSIQIEEKLRGRVLRLVKGEKPSLQSNP